jgi:NitT/TauT family transport system permease protein
VVAAARRVVKGDGKGRLLSMNRVRSIRVAVVLASVATLETLCRLGIIPEWAMTPPTQAFVVLAHLLRSGELNTDIQNSLRCIALALGLSLVLGFVGGVVVYALPRLRRLLDPLMATYYAIPHFIFYPLFIVFFGMGPFPLVMIGFLSAVVAMIINTLNGLDRVPEVLMETAQVYHMGRVRTACFIILPCASSHIFTGVKLAVAYSFIGVIGSEFILSTGGIGHQISFLYFAFENDKMYAVILFILLLVTSINMLLHSWDTRLQSRRAR